MARRTLARPPSERYAASGGEVPPAVVRGASPGSMAPRALAPELAALAAAIGTLVALVAVGGILELLTGLLFVAGVGGALIGLLVAGSSRPRRTRRGLAVGLATGAVAVAALGIWLIARAEGGTLGLFDFLWATGGLLVPAEAIVAALAAAWGESAGPIRG